MNDFWKKVTAGLRPINQKNSTIGVQCDAVIECNMRFTTLCEDCGHNRGPRKTKSCYVPK